MLNKILDALEGKEVKQAVRQYVLQVVNSIDPNEWGVDDDTLLARLTIINTEWQDSGNYAYEKRREPNDIKRFTYWVNGLPNCFTLDVYDNDIVHRVISWGLPQREPKPYTKQQSIDLYYLLIVRELEKIMKENGINLF